ncbi:14055_t:CDS:2, partial [Dentiscutata heterogama]
MKNGNRLVPLIKEIIELVTNEVVNNLKTVQVKYRRPRLCYNCRKPGHLAKSCTKECRIGNGCADVRWMDAEINGERIEHVKEKGKIGDSIRGTFVKINEKAAKASIRFSSSVNKMSMKYAKGKGLTWKWLDKKRIPSNNTNNEFVGYIPDVKVDVCDVSIYQTFYVVRTLTPNIVLGMPWIAKSSCNIQWKNGQCHYAIESGLKKATFIMNDQLAKGEKVDNENNDGMENDLVDVRCVQSELMKNDDGKKKKRIVSVMNKRVTNQTKGLNFKNIPIDESCDEESCRDKHHVYDCESMMETEKGEKDITDMRSTVNELEKNGTKGEETGVKNDEVTMCGIDVHMNNEKEEDIIKIFGDKATQENEILPDVESRGSSSDGRAKTDNRVVNGEGKTLNNDCRNSLMEQWVKKRMMFMNNRIRDPAWLRNSEHRLIKMYGITTVMNRKVDWNHAVSCDGEKVEFLKRLYLDHIIGNDGL